jgi:PPOX class probable F420-dependent enzyme
VTVEIGGVAVPFISVADLRTNKMATGRLRDRADVADRHRWVFTTMRADGRPQLSLVTGALTSSGLLAIASYPGRAKTANARRDPRVSVLVMGDLFDDAWIQIDDDATVLHMPDVADGLVEYYRAISGEHPDWDEYRQAMDDQGKSVILVEPTRWGPVSTGGFPPSLFE